MNPIPKKGTEFKIKIKKNKKFGNVKLNLFTTEGREQMVKLQCPSPILYINLASQQSCVFFVIFFVSLCAKCVCESTQPLLVNHAVVTDAVCIYCSLLKYAMASLEKRCHLHGSMHVMDI